jgi:RimJ/RimL family protein N-acetyltransferase
VYPSEKTEAKSMTLNDGTEVCVRPIQADDAEKFYWFLGGLTDEDRRYLRIDVTDRDFIIDRIQNPHPSIVVRLIAETDREIVGEALLEIPRDRWESEIGEIRLVIAPGYRRKGMGRRLAREIYFRAIERRLRKIVARMMRPQRGARRIFRRLGFSEEALLPDHVTDMQGQAQDLLVMSLDIEELKRDLKDHHELWDMRIRR